MKPPLVALTLEQEQLAQQTRDIARKILVPISRSGESGRVNRRLVRALAEQGILPRLYPDTAGGSAAANVSAVQLALLRENLARESTEAETALAVQALGSYPILQAGSEQVIRRWIPAVARGEAVAAFALTEPIAGSDAGAIEMAAERDGNDYRLSGMKTFISHAPDADVYTLFARTTPGTGTRGITAFVVSGDASGLRGTPLRLLAGHPIGRLELDGVLVASDNVLGELDQGFRLAMRTLDLFRPSVGAAAVGMAEAAMDAAVIHAGNRRAFGRPLREFQAVSHQLAEMATKIEAARLLVYSAAVAYDSGAKHPAGRSSMAKLFATEMAQFVVDAAIQIHGAVALEEGHLLEHLYRAVRAPRIYEGTSEIQREIIVRELYRGISEGA